MSPEIVSTLACTAATFLVIAIAVSVYLASPSPPKGDFRVKASKTGNVNIYARYSEDRPWAKNAAQRVEGARRVVDSDHSGGLLVIVEKYYTADEVADKIRAKIKREIDENSG